MARLATIKQRACEALEVAADDAETARLWLERAALHRTSAPQLVGNEEEEEGDEGDDELRTMLSERGSPVAPAEARCQLRAAFGNGLRPEIWAAFQRRYSVGRVVEFYGATEGNANLVNNCDVVGAIGVVPWFARCVYPVFLARFDATGRT